MWSTPLTCVDRSPLWSAVSARHGPAYHIIIAGPAPSTGKQGPRHYSFRSARTARGGSFLFHRFSSLLGLSKTVCAAKKGVFSLCVFLRLAPPHPRFPCVDPAVYGVVAAVD